jgi:polysaccharide pyruvyl transferase WcaK-like protein
MPAEPLRVGLLWHSVKSGNLGVGALTVGNLAIARQAAERAGVDLRFTVIGSADQAPAYVRDADVTSFDVTGRSMVAPSGVWRVLREQDCVLDIGGGDSFTEIYGPKRFFYLWTTKAKALLGRVPLVLSPQTIGPFSKEPYLALARTVMTGARAVYARDRLSLDALRKIAPDAKGELSVDVAFALPYEDRSRLRSGPRLRVGINVSGLMFNEAEAGTNRFGLSVNYAVLIRRLLKALSERADVEVNLIVHVRSYADPHDDDGPVADRLAGEFPGVVRVPDFEGPSEAKSFISGLDFLTAGRMHACIAAYSSGTPVVPVAYSRKFVGLFGLLDYPWLVPVKGVDEAGALAYVLDALERRDELSAEIRKGLGKVDGLLEVYRSGLVALFQDVAARR